MKRYIPILILLLIGCLLFPVAADGQALYDISGILRLHVRAEDDSEAEQALKLKVRDTVLRETTRLLSDAESRPEAEAILRENLDKIRDAAQQTVQTEGYDHKVTAALNREWFEYREYDGFFLPEGEYDALVVNIGSGEGHNWWCVVFPALCISGASEGQVAVDGSKIPEEFSLSNAPTPENQPVKYEFWIVKVLKNLFSSSK